MKVNSQKQDSIEGIRKVFSKYHLYDELIQYFRLIIEAKTDGYVIVTEEILRMLNSLVSLYQFDWDPSVKLMTIERFFEEISCFSTEKEKKIKIFLNDYLLKDDKRFFEFLEKLKSMALKYNLSVDFEKQIYLSSFVESNQYFLCTEKIGEDHYGSQHTFYYPSQMNRLWDLTWNSYYLSATSPFLYTTSLYINDLKEFRRYISRCDGISKKSLVLQKEAIEKGLYSFIAFIPDFPFFRKLIDFSCIHFSYNMHYNNYTITPVVFLKPLQNLQLDEIIRGLKDFFGLVLGDYDDLENQKFEQMGCNTKYQFIINLLGKIYGAYYLWKFTEIRENDLENVNSSQQLEKIYFGKQISFSLRKILNIFEKHPTFIQNLDDYLKNIEDVKYDSKDLDFYSCFSLPYLDLGSMFQNVSFDSMRKCFEVLHEKNNICRDRTIKVDFIRFEKEFMRVDREKTKEKFYVEVLSCLTSGIATLSTDENVDGISRLVLKDGQQSYRVLLDPYMMVLKYLAKIEKDGINLLSPSLSSYKTIQFITEVLALNSNLNTDELNQIRYYKNLMNYSYEDLYVERDQQEDENQNRIYQKIYSKIC